MEQPIGMVTHYYGKLGVATVELKEKISQGDEIRFLGKETDFKEKVSSLQFDHDAVKEAGEHQEVGIKVSQRVREGDEVFKII